VGSILGVTSSSCVAVFYVDSDEGDRRHVHAETAQADSCHKLQRISDADMFISDIVDQQRVSGDSRDDRVHSTSGTEVVQLSESPCILTISSTELDTAESQPKQTVESCLDVDMLNDVEPDDTPDSQGIEVMAPVQAHTESSCSDDDNSEIICSLVTQSSIADQSFHTCPAVDMDFSMVKIQLFFIFNGDTFICNIYHVLTLLVRYLMCCPNIDDYLA